MKNFIELTTFDDKKCLININTINFVWDDLNNAMVSTNNDMEGCVYQESYEEVKELILKAQNETNN